jgi:hypothetical protein
MSFYNPNQTKKTLNIMKLTVSGHISVFVKKLTPYTLAGFDLTTHSSSLLNVKRRRYH